MTQHDSDAVPELPNAMKKAARDYNKPPELSGADLDAMWTEIESAAFPAGDVIGTARPRVRPARTMWVAARSLTALAATLVLGVTIGRWSAQRPAAPAAVVASRPASDSLALAEPYQSTTSRYLGQTAALLVALPSEVRAGHADDRFMGRAQDLLSTTRLLLDSPAAADPRFRALLDDLELVLAQVARLQHDQSPAELELIRRALDQRDVLPRLRTAVADISADN